MPEPEEGTSSALWRLLSEWGEQTQLSSDVRLVTALLDTVIAG